MMPITSSEQPSVARAARRPAIGPVASRRVSTVGRSWTWSRLYLTLILIFCFGSRFTVELGDVTVRPEYALAGVAAHYHAICISAPLFYNRGEKPTAIEVWDRVFVIGSALVLEALAAKGFSRETILGGKHRVLRDFRSQHCA